MAFASWWTWPPVEWARWMWTAVTGSGDSSLQVLQGNLGERQVVYLLFMALMPAGLGARGTPRAHWVDSNSCSSLMLGGRTPLFFSYQLAGSAKTSGT